MTFSIVARSPDGLSWGVAVASKFLAVGAAVPAARANVGAVATQSLPNLSFKPRGLELMRGGCSAQETLDQLIANDEGRHERQAGVVDRAGRAATFTGDGCYGWAGGITDTDFAIQGNILTGPEVVEAMQTAWDASFEEADFASRLLAALTAGDQAGGDRRGRQSAALLVVREGAGYGFDDVAVDLRVDDHAGPTAELARLYEIHQLLHQAPGLHQRVMLSHKLRAELDDRARHLGHSGLRAWVDTENFEMRVDEGPTPDWVDEKVLALLRARTEGSA